MEYSRTSTEENGMILSKEKQTIVTFCNFSKKQRRNLKTNHVSTKLLTGTL